VVTHNANDSQRVSQLASRNGYEFYECVVFPQTFHYLPQGRFDLAHCPYRAFALRYLP
jgi:hypothetical protein